MKLLKATLVSTCPMLMHNGNLANPMNKFSRRIKDLVPDAKKTDEGKMAMARAEWFGGLYTDRDPFPNAERLTGSEVADKNCKVVIPLQLIFACLIKGAGYAKNGTKMKAALYPTNEDCFPLKYKDASGKLGPKDLEHLYVHGEFSDYRAVGVNGRSKVMRSRPIFPSWSANIQFQFDEEIIDDRDVEKALKVAGQRCGIGDYKPMFGRFSVENILIEKVDPDVGEVAAE